MEFKGAVKISRCKVDKACINFKNIHDQTMAVLNKKKEESKALVIPFYILGIKVPFLKTTKYYEYGFEDHMHQSTIDFLGEILLNQNTTI